MMNVGKNEKPGPPGQDHAAVSDAESKAAALGAKLHGSMPPGWRFALILFDSRETDAAAGYVTYISDAQTTQELNMLRQAMQFMAKRVQQLHKQGFKAAPNPGASPGQSPEPPATAHPQPPPA